MTIASTLVPASVVARHRRLVAGAATGLGLHVVALIATLVHLGLSEPGTTPDDDMAGRFLTHLAVEATISPTVFMAGIVLSIVPPTRRFGLGLLAGAALGVLVAVGYAVISIA